MKREILKAEDITVAYNGKPVIKNIDLIARKGDFIGIVGPNGSGKTTLLKSLNHSIQPKKGQVFLDNKRIETLPRRVIAQKIAVVPQVIESRFPLTVEEVVSLGRLPYKNRFADIDNRGLSVVESVFKMFNLKDFATKKVSQLSGGEKQRVFLALAIAQESEILILDEPTSHLDISFQLEVLDLVRERQEKGLTVIAVFHDLNLASQYCQEIIFLRDGNVFISGKTDEVMCTENIKEVFGIEVEVSRHPISGKLFIHSVSRDFKYKKSEKGLWIHLVCGMGSGSNLMKRFIRQGHKVTCGVINVLDTDEETAQSLGLDYIAEAPFSEITDEADILNRKLMKSADFIILLDIPFGPGNLKNLKAVYDLAKKGKKVLVLGSSSKKEKDFTEGQADAIFKDLSDTTGVKFLNNYELLFELVNGQPDEE